MNSSLKKRINRLTKRNNRLSKRGKRSKRSNRLTKRSKRINRLTKRSKRSKRSNRLTKRSKRNRLTKRSNRLSKRRELHGGAVITVIKTNDGTTYYEIKTSDMTILVTIQDLKNLSDRLRGLYSSKSCLLEKGEFNWDDLWSSINKKIRVSEIESYLKELYSKLEELFNDTSIGPKCRKNFKDAWETFKKKGNEMFLHIDSQVNEGKLLKYSHGRNLYIFDPLDVTTGKKYSVDSTEVDIFDPKTGVTIAAGVIMHKNSDNETAEVDWNYLTDGMIPNSEDFLTNVSLKALRWADSK